MKTAIMHRLARGAALLALAVSATSARATADDPMPVFEFMGQTTESAPTMTMIKDKPCKTEGDEYVCAAYLFPFAGQLAKMVSLKFYKGRLYDVTGAVNSKYTGDVLAAFSAKYGSPIAETRTWQNRQGSTFDNPTFIWKFRCGDLVLESLGWDIDTSNFAFTCAANQPPPEEPVVDF